MTSAVHGGIHNVSCHVVAVGCVGIMSGIYELVIPQNRVLIYSSEIYMFLFARQFPLG